MPISELTSGAFANHLIRGLVHSYATPRTTSLFATPTMIGASGDVGRNQIAGFGAAVSSYGVASVAKLAKDDLIDTFAIVGTVDALIEGFGRLVAAGLEVLLVWYPFGPDPGWEIDTLAFEVRPALRTLGAGTSHGWR